MKTERIAVDTLFDQITHEAASALRKETSMLPLCCLCGLIRDEIGASLDGARWVTQETYRTTHSVNPADCLHTHTYCPGCLTQVMETMGAAQVLEALMVTYQDALSSVERKHRGLPTE